MGYYEISLVCNDCNRLGIFAGIDVKEAVLKAEDDGWGLYSYVYPRLMGSKLLCRPCYIYRRERGFTLQPVIKRYDSNESENDGF